MNQPDPERTKAEQLDRNLDRIAEKVQRAKIVQDLERMPKPATEPERPTADDTPVWERQEDGSLKKAA